MSWLQRWLGAAPRSGQGARRADPNAFAAYLGSRAAFVAQKTVLDYCAVKFGRHWDKARQDAAFAEALKACTWAVYWPAAGDMMLAGGTWLLPHAPSPVRLADALAGLASACLDGGGAPQSGSPESAARGEAEAMLRLRIVSLGTDPPRSIARMALAASRPLLETLPVHPDQRRGEDPAILGGLRMNFLGMVQDMERAFDPEPLAAALDALAGAAAEPTVLPAPTAPDRDKVPQ